MKVLYSSILSISHYLFGPLPCLFAAFSCFFLLTACSSEPATSIPTNPSVSMIKTDQNLYINSPAWSPNGKIIAVEGTIRCQTEACEISIYAVDPQNGHTWPLVNNVGGAMEPAWTSDGRLSFRNLDPHLPGGEGFDITGVSSFHPVFFQNIGSDLSWSSDGKFAAFDLSRYDKTTNLIQDALEVINLQTNVTREIYHTPWASRNSFLCCFHWTFTGDRLLFKTGWYSGGNTDESHLYSIQPDGSQLREYGKDITGLIDGGWLRNDQWLYITSRSSPLAFLNTQNGCVTYTDVEGIGITSISPDGSQIAFVNTGELGIVDLKKVLGQNFEKLTCPK